MIDFGRPYPGENDPVRAPGLRQSKSGRRYIRVWRALQKVKGIARLLAFFGYRRFDVVNEVADIIEDLIFGAASPPMTTKKQALQYIRAEINRRTRNPRLRRAMYAEAHRQIDYDENLV